MAKDYYKILGVSRDATEVEIKRAYRKLAHQYHPDKGGGDEKKFKEINEAYQVLSNKEKRSQYDQFGSTFEDIGRGGGFRYEDFARADGPFGFDFGKREGFRTEGVNFDFSDLGDIFGDFFGFGRRSRTPRGTRMRRRSDIETELEVDFREAVFGTEKPLNLYKTVPCPKCGGDGAEPGTKIITCRTCQGSGQVINVQRTFLGQMRINQVCPDCEGQGRIPEKVCSKCKGQGIVQDTRRIKVKIPAGISSGQSIRLSGEGEAGIKGGSAGDLYILIRVKPDPEFEREGDDILSQVEISFSQAALGSKIKINTLESPGYLKIPPGTQSGKVFRLKGKGIPHLKSRGRGDQLVKVVVKTPEKLSRKEKRLLGELAQIQGEGV